MFSRPCEDGALDSRVTVGERRDYSPVAVAPNSVERAHAASVQRFWTTVLIVVVWSWICVPKIVQTLLSPKYRLKVGQESAPYSPFASAADQLLYLAVIVVCGLIVIGYLNRLVAPTFPALLVLLAPWVFLVVRDLYIPKTLSNPGVAYVLIVVAVWFLRPNMSQLKTLGYLVGFTALISVAIAVVIPAKAIFQTAAGEVILDDKQIIPGGLLVGIFTQGNNLGQFLVLGLPTVFLIGRSKVKSVFVALVLLAILWSASRGALIALGVGALTWTTLRLSPPALRAIAAPLAMAVPLSAACVIPLVTTAPDAFTNRGLIWVVSLEAWRGAPWFGWGSNWYNRIGETSNRIAGSVFHGHNQLVQFLVTGGIVLTALAALLCVVLMMRATRHAVAGSLFAATWVAMLFGTCLMEKSFSFVDNGNFLVVTVLPMAFILLGRLSGRPAQRTRSNLETSSRGPFHSEV